MRRLLLIFMLLGGFAFAAKAQQPNIIKRTSVSDSLNHKADSASSQTFRPKGLNKKAYQPDSLHSPHKAVMRSLIVPGWGQVYNGHWWKVPLIYGALGTLGYFIFYNQRDYEDFLAVAVYQRNPVSDDINLPKYDTIKHIAAIRQYHGYNSQAVINQKDYSLRSRDLCILGFLLTWGVNCIDSYVFAKFQHSYSMDNNFAGVHISGGLTPGPGSFASNFNTTFTPTIKLTLTLR